MENQERPSGQPESPESMPTTAASSACLICRQELSASETEWLKRSGQAQLCREPECEAKYAQRRQRGWLKRNDLLRAFCATLPPLFGRLQPEPAKPVNRAGLFLSGESGVGKTFAAVVAAVREIERDPPAGERYRGPGLVRAIEFHDVSELLMRVQSGFDKGRSENGEVNRIAGVPVLILDDLGAERRSDWSISFTGRLLNMREKLLLPTIVTSNLTLEEIHAMDIRIAGRLGAMNCITLEGRDRRLDR